MNDKHLKCLICGGDLCWDSSVNLRDVTDAYDDDCGVVEHLHCMKCGRSSEITDPSQEERNTSYREYWNDGRDT